MGIRRRAVGECGGTHDIPVQGTVADIGFLSLVIGKGRTRQQAEHQAFPEKIQRIVAVARTQSGFADQSFHAVFAHRIDDIFCANAAHTAFTARAKGNQYRIMVLYRGGDRGGIKDIAPITGQIFMVAV